MRTLLSTLLVVSGIVALSTGCDADGERSVLLVTPGMARTLPYDGYDPNPLTGKTLLTPPEGTLPMGVLPFPYGPGEKEALRAANEVKSPYAIAPSASQMKRGKHVYEIMCAVCHGEGGEGDGPIIGRFPNPPSLLADKTKGMSDGQMMHVVTRGQGIMPAYAVQVLPDDRWRAIAHVRKLQGLLKEPEAEKKGGTP